MADTIRIKLKKSVIGKTQKQRDIVRCLGLGRINSEVVVKNNPAMRGMIMKIQHMLEVTVEK